MSWTQGEFAIGDDIALGEYRWPVEDPWAEVVLFHGIAEHLGRYDHVGAAFNEAGISVSGVDIRGHGRSPVELKTIDSYRVWLDDHALYVQSVMDRADVPVFAVGHSLGGCLSLTLAGERRLPVQGLVTSGAAVKVADDLAPLARKAAGLLSRFTPNLGIPAGLSSNISRDPAVVAAYEADPLVPLKIPARIGAEGIALIEDCEAILLNIDLPLLVMHGTADELTPVEGLDLVQQLSPSEDATYRRLDGWYHELFNEPEHAQLLADVIAWIHERTT